MNNILANPRVALVMEEDGPVAKSDRDLKGIQCIGTATILSDDGVAEAPKVVQSRHHAFNSVNPGNSVIVKVTPTKIYLIDYARGFRHRDVLEL